MKKTALIVAAGLAAALTASTASAQGITAHAPPSDRAAQGALIPAIKPANAGAARMGIIVEDRKTDPAINYANTGDNRVHGAGGGAGHGSERMGLVMEDRKLVGTTSETYTPGGKTSEKGSGTGKKGRGSYDLKSGKKV